MEPSKTRFSVGDRVICPAVDEIPGTVIEVGYNGYTKVEYDDGQIGMTEAKELQLVSSHR